MAKMIPEIPREYDPASLEGVMFSALEKLPEDYLVIHSFKQVFVVDNILHEGEADFIIFNPKLGILCVEAKAGRVRYEEGNWKYASGKNMKHGGPYNQAANNKWALLAAIQNGPLKGLARRCKCLHAVWFPSIKKSELYSNHFPQEFERNLTMTMEALENPEDAILSIFSIELPNHVKTDLSENEAKRLLREVFCPEFNIFPPAGFEHDLKKMVFHRLLKEQQNILNYLVEQKTAVINGAAGTGKTMIAVEKAMRHASNGERVLFLCYNAYLKEYLADTFKHQNIDYLTISGFACKLCGTEQPDYKRACDKILDMYLSGTFPYVHVIVDEGQDFGMDNIEEADILQCIHDTVMDNDEVDGTFYVFYDKLQLIQSKQIPKYISDADCKLTLYRNCRNTENIAITSLKPISERSPKLFEGAVKGIPANIHFVSEEDAVATKIENIINRLKAENISDIVILTCKTEDKSTLAKCAQNGKYKNVKFTSCRKFKGLEADAVILIDVDENVFKENQKLLFYVGTSRARLVLDIVTDMDDLMCEEVLENVIRYNKKIKKPKREFAMALNAVPIV